MKNVGPCHACQCEMNIPDALYEAARASEAISFYCAYGHSQHYPKGETKTQKLQRELDRARQKIAEKDDEIRVERDRKEAADRRAAAARGQVTKMRNRVGNGVCPCCSRHFTNLERHMHSKHPDFSSDNVVPLHGAGGKE